MVVTVQTTATTNPEPYCAELYNARELPYGFFSFDLPQLFGEGFPVFFDINLSADDVASFYEYVEEGLYYDSNTRCALLQHPAVTIILALSSYILHTYAVISLSQSPYGIASNVHVCRWSSLNSGQTGSIVLRIEAIPVTAPGRASQYPMLTVLVFRS